MCIRDSCNFGKAKKGQRNSEVMESGDGRVVLLEDFGFSPATKRETDFLVYRIDTSKSDLYLREGCLRGSAATQVENEKLHEFLAEHWGELQIASHLEDQSVSEEGWLDLVSIHVPEHLFPEMRTALGSEAVEVEQRGGEWMRISVVAKWFR